MAADDVAHDDGHHLSRRQPESAVVPGQVAPEVLVETDAPQEVVDDRKAPEALAHQLEGPPPELLADISVIV